MAGTLEDAPKRMAETIMSMKSHNAKQKPKTNLSSFVQTRLQGPLKLSEESATLLMARSVIQKDAGLCWSNDKRLKYTSMMRLPEPVIISFIQSIECPVLGVFALDGIFSVEKLKPRWQELKSENQQAWFKGGHHLHLDGDVPAIANTIHSFISSNA